MATKAVLKKNIVQSFRLKGLTLKVEAVNYLTDLLENQFDQRDDYIQAILKHLAAQNLKHTVIDAKILQNLLTELAENDGASQSQQDSMSVDDTQDATFVFPKNSFGFLNADQFPKFKYDLHRKMFYPTEKGGLFGSAADKRDMYLQRLRAVHQRLARSSLFAKPVIPFGTTDDYDELVAIESLLGEGHSNLAKLNSKTENFKPKKRWVMGMLSQLQEGRYYLEDLHGKIPIDYSFAEFLPGMFTEGCIVFVEGEMSVDPKDGSEILKVVKMGFPPAESRKDSMRVFAPVSNQAITSGFDAFGLHPSPIFMEKFQKGDFDESYNASTIIAMADVWMDLPRVVERLKALFDILNAPDFVPPQVIVLMGSFTSPNATFQEKLSAQPSTIESHPLRKALEDLTDIIASYDRLSKHTKWVIVPGPNDLGSASSLPILPQHSFPKCFVNGLEDKIPDNLIFASNPCRLRIFDQQITIFRDDLLTKMRKSCIVNPNDKEVEEPAMHLVQTLLDQGHLCPLPLNTQPVYWNYEHTLHLYPLPDLVLLGDKYDRYKIAYRDCNCTNASSFASDYGFIRYEVASRMVSFASAATLGEDEDGNGDEVVDMDAETQAPSHAQEELDR